MRDLTKKQKRLLTEWAEEGNIFKVDDLSFKQLLILQNINDTEVLYQNINYFLNDLD